MPVIYPFSQYTVMSFVISLIDEGKKHSTIMTYLSAIAFAHKVRGVPDPTSTFLFSKFTTGLRKSLAADESPRLQPITFIMLKELIALVDNLRTSRMEKSLLKAVMSLMYHACLRISEIGKSNSAKHAIRSKNVRFSTRPPSAYPNKLTITLTSFKHSKGSKTLEIRAIKDHRICPVRLLQEYVDAKKPSVTLFCNNQGKPITRSYVMTRLQELVAMSSFRLKRVNTHSFRIGRTTDLVLKGGVSDAYIRHVGRWSSTAYLKYVRSVVSL